MANLNLKFLRGLQNALPTTGTDGYFYLTTDTHRLYAGIDGKVVPVNEGVATVANLEALTAVTGANAGDFFYCTAENILCVFNGQTFVQINPDTGVTSVEVVGEGNAVTDASYDADTRKLTLTKGETFATKGELDALAGKVGEVPEGSTVMGIITNIQENAYDDTELRGIIDNKVDKVDGKGLSTNDLTDELKGQYDAAYSHSQADHAPVDAQANIIEAVKVNGEALEIKDKAVDITVPTGALAGKDKVAKDDLAEALATELDNKVEKVDGKSLILDTEIARLAAMKDGANKVEKSETNGNIKIDGEEVVVYTHVEKHAIADVDGLQDALNGLQAKGDYAAEEHTHTKDEITDFEHTHVAADITDLDDTIKGYDYATKTELGNVDKKFADYKTAADQKVIDDEQDRRLGVLEAKPFDTYAVKTEVEGALALKADKSVVDAMYTNGQIDTAVQGAKDYAKGLVDAIPAQTDYTVTITEATDGLDAGIAKKYTFTQNGAEIGTINLAKELVVTAGSVKEVTEEDAPYTGAKVGDKYIELVIANQDAPIYVPAKDLVDIYTAKDGAAEVQVAISNINEISATLVNGGITEEKLNADIKTKLNKTWEEVGVAKGLVDALAETHAADKAALEKAIADGDAAAKEDAANQAAVVLAEAQKYTDAAKAEAIADAADKYETKGTAQGIVDCLKLSETYEPIGAEARAIAAAEGKVNALAGEGNTSTVKKNADDIASLFEMFQWGSF